MTKAEAKEFLRIPEIWRRFNLAGEPGVICSSPFRPDKNPSFSVSEDGKLWNDFATGEAGDAIDFLERCQPAGEFLKVRAFIDYAASIYGRGAGPGPPPAASFLSDKCAMPGSEPNPLESALARFRAPDESDCRIIAACRGLSPVAVDLARALGTLVVGKVGGFSCWILTDTSRRCAEARRFDGAPFPAIGKLGERKAHTLKGSRKDWPLGLAPRIDVSLFKTILLVEGGPDYLAALQLCDLAGGEVLPVAMLGAGVSISDEARLIIGRRRVIIQIHADDAGGSAAHRWGAILERSGAQVILRPWKVREFGNDLNDILRHFGCDESALHQIAVQLLR